MAPGERLIADIIARLRERQAHSSDDLEAMESELRAKWDGKRCYASKAARDALEGTARPRVAVAFGKGTRPM